MKNIYCAFALIVIVFSLMMSIVSCKKNNKTTDGYCPIGGFSSTASIMFWVSKDYGGGIYTVQVTDDAGNNDQLDTNQISVYDLVTPNACNTTDPNYLKHALTGLRYGHTFNWTATSSNRVFKGKIVVPCDDTYNCKTIQIDQ